MNVLNVEAVVAFCEGYARRADRAEDAAAWLRSNLRNHVLRTPAYHVRADGRSVVDLVARGLADGEPTWLEAALARGDAVVAFDPGTAAAVALAGECDRVLDWLVSPRRVPAGDALRKASFADASAASDAWHDAMARRRVTRFAKRARITPRAATAILAADDPGVADLWPEDPTGVEEVAVLGDGLRVVRLLSKDALDREGTLLDHCVATYADAVAQGRSEILSVRGDRNLPLATLETVAYARSAHADALLAPYLPEGFRVVQQAYGRRNSPVPEGLRAALAAWAEGSGLGTAYGRSREADAGVARHVDAEAMARDIGAIVSRDATSPRAKPGPFASRAARFASCPGRIGTAGMKAMLAAYLPGPDAVSFSADPVPGGSLSLAVVRTVVPVGAFSPVAAPLREADPDALHDASVRTADAVIAAVSAASGTAHVVTLSVPDAFPSTDAFFAYCGRLPEWTSAQERARTECRRLAGDASARARALLRTGGLTQPERDSLLNAINVWLPAFLAASAPARQRQPAVRPAGREEGGRTLRRLVAAGTGKARLADGVSRAV